MNLILFEPGELEKPLSAVDPRAVHLLRVLHAKEGDTVKAGVIDGPIGTAKIVAVTRSAVDLEFTLQDTPPEPYPLTVAVGHPRPIVARRLMKDLTTIGVARICFLGADLGEQSYRDARMWEGDLRASLVEGASQARTSRLPQIVLFEGVRTFLEAIDLSAGDAAGPNRVLLDLAEGLPPVLGLDYPSRQTVLAVGPERGWSGREQRLFTEAHFTAGSLGSRPLRTETACTVGAAFVLAACGYLE